MNVADVIASYCHAEPVAHWLADDRRHSRCWAGETLLDGYSLMEVIAGADDLDRHGFVPSTFVLMAEVGDWPDVIFWRADSERALLRFVRGGLALEVFNDSDAYLGALDRARRRGPHGVTVGR